MAGELEPLPLGVQLQEYIPEYPGILYPHSLVPGQLEIASYDTVFPKLSFLNIVLGGQPGTVNMDAGNVNEIIRKYLANLGGVNNAHPAVAAIDFTAMAQLPRDTGEINFAGLVRIQINRGLEAQLLALNEPIVRGETAGILFSTIEIAKKAMSVWEYSGPDATNKMMARLLDYLRKKKQTRQLPTLQ